MHVVELLGTACFGVDVKGAFLAAGTSPVVRTAQVMSNVGDAFALETRRSSS